MAWIIDTINNVYSYSSNLLATPIIYNAATGTITVASRPALVATFQDFLKSWHDALEWRNAMAKALDLMLPVLTSALPEVIGKVSDMPVGYRATSHVRRRPAGVKIELIHEIPLSVPVISYVVDLSAQQVEMSENIGYTAPLAQWDTRLVFVNTMLDNVIRYL